MLTVFKGASAHDMWNAVFEDGALKALAPVRGLEHFRKLIHAFDLANAVQGRDPLPAHDLEITTTSLQVSD